MRDGVFSNLAMHAFKALTNVFESLKDMATEDFAEGRRLIPGVVAEGGLHVPTSARLASGIVSQVGPGGDGAVVSTNRHVLLTAVLNLMEEFMSLVLYLLRPLPGGMSVLQKYDRAYATELMSSDEQVLSFAQEKSTEGFILSGLSFMAVNSDPDTRLQARLHAGQMLSHIVELRYLLS